MPFDPTFNRKIIVVLHSLGLSCIGGAIFLQLLVFSSILYEGNFKAVETNPIILAGEMVLTVFGLIYFIYFYLRLILKVK
jgi:hypothetical protein